MPTGPPLLCHSLPGTCVKHLVRSVFPKPHCGSLTPIYDLSISEPHYPNPPPHASFLIYKMGISITFLTAGETEADLLTQRGHGLPTGPVATGQSSHVFRPLHLLFSSLPEDISPDSSDRHSGHEARVREGRPHNPETCFST